MADPNVTPAIAARSAVATASAPAPAVTIVMRSVVALAAAFAARFAAEFVTIATVAAVAVTVALGVSGCHIASAPYQGAEIGIAEQWSTSAANDRPAACAGCGESVIPADRWWRRFDDAQLTGLIDEVLNNNTEIRIAAERSRQAELALDRAAARSAPRVSGDLQHRWGSSATGRYRGADATLSITQELDVWGVQAGTRHAAIARVQAAAFARADTERKLIGLVGQAYWQAALLNEQQRLAAAMLVDARRVQALAVSRHARGATGIEPVVTATGDIADVEAELAAVAARRQAAGLALAYLLGRPDAPPQLEAARLPASEGIPAIDAGVPADLLARRPDVQKKERQLRASLAEVDVARANLYPRISLTGSLGSASNDLISLLTRPVSTLTGRIVLPFLDWRTRQLDIDVAENSHTLAKLAFEQTLHQALREVEEALIQRSRYMTEEIARRSALTARRREEALAASRFDEGATDMTPWLDKRQIRQRAEQALLRTRFDRVANMMTLYLALGGDAVTDPEERDQVSIQRSNQADLL